MSLFIQCILCQSGFLLSVYLGMRLKRDGYINLIFFSWHVQFIGGLRGHDRLIVGYAATCAITIKVVWVRIPIMARSTRYNIMWKSFSGRRFSPGTSVNGNCTGSCISNYQTIMTTKASNKLYMSWKKNKINISITF
jgi:uncharacterized membrane protein YjgN (DUF898 family)